MLDCLPHLFSVLPSNKGLHFGHWFEKYDPKVHDAIMGPVKEFLADEKALNYDEEPVGGEFIRIGIGALRNPEERRFGRFKTYGIVDGG
jgi:hypothetical protein